MTYENNKMLSALSRIWAWRGDWMVCRKCNRALIASRDGEPIIHKSGCEHEGHLHPWSDLRRALSSMEGKS